MAQFTATEFDEAGKITAPAEATGLPLPTHRPLVGVVMGSRSDWDTMVYTVETLQALKIPFEARVVSAHRTPDLLFAYATEAEGRGLEVIIAGAGGAAHLPGMLAAKTVLPVLGVPVQSKALNGVDSLHSIVQMPAGIPVGTLAIGRAGAINAALLSAALLGNKYPEARTAYHQYRLRQTDAVLSDAPLPIPGLARAHPPEQPSSSASPTARHAEKEGPSSSSGGAP